MPRTHNRMGVLKSGVSRRSRLPRVVGLTALALSVTMFVAGCSGADLIERTEQANRLQAASAFGALTADIEATKATDYPGSTDLGAVKRWDSTSTEQLASTSRRFASWSSLAQTLTFVPSPPPGPSEAGITAFNQSYAEWSATRAAYVRAVRRCLNGDKKTVVRRCLGNVQSASAAGRIKTDAALSREIAAMRLSLSTTERSPAGTSTTETTIPTATPGSPTAQ